MGPRGCPYLSGVVSWARSCVLGPLRFALTRCGDTLAGDAAGGSTGGDAATGAGDAPAAMGAGGARPSITTVILQKPVGSPAGFAASGGTETGVGGVHVTSVDADGPANDRLYVDDEILAFGGMSLEGFMNDVHILQLGIGNEHIYPDIDHNRWTEY